MGLIQSKARFTGVVLLFLSLLSVFSTASAQAIEPYPTDYFALRPVMRNVQVSPDGEHLALLLITSRDGNPIIEVHKVSDLINGKKAEPFRVGADPMEIETLRWVSNEVLIVTLRQKVREKIEGFNEGVFEGKIARLDIKRQQMKAFDEEVLAPMVEHILPQKPNHIIVSYFDTKARGSKVKEIFRPRSYHEMDVTTGHTRLLLRGQPELAQIQFDAEGDPITARGFDFKRDEFTWFYRQKDSSKWEEVYRVHEDKFEQFSIEGYDNQNRDILFVVANNGFNTAGLWEFSASQKKFLEPIYRRNDIDVFGVEYHSNAWAKPREVAGLVTVKEKREVHYFDQLEAAAIKQLSGLIEHAHDVLITSRAREGQTLTFLNQGPRDPGSYYLLAEGKVLKVGSRQPLLEGDKLADVRYITYKARDGKTIPAYLTVPQGEPPFPLVVLPHGGPFVQEYVGYDEWGQLLANNGYMVLQPQYRGSMGYGLDFYTSAFEEGGQGGYKMQDDKDDGALHLVKEGLADRERLAMFGWSYGGYAALVAAAREDQIYQCVIAGAAVSDTNHQVNFYRDQLRGAQETEQVNMWDDSIAPISEAAKVNVPILIIHGDVDQRVPVIHAKRYTAALDKAGIDYDYLELDGADHFYDTLYYEHKSRMYGRLIEFLKNDCGPGGL